MTTATRSQRPDHRLDDVRHGLVAQLAQRADETRAHWLERLDSSTANFNHSERTAKHMLLEMIGALADRVEALESERSRKVA